VVSPNKAQTAVAYSAQTESEAAGRDLGAQLKEQLQGRRPDAAIVFVSAKFDYEKLLAAFAEACDPVVLVGSSSAGEFTDRERGEGTACALALCSPGIEVAAGLGRAVSQDRAIAARDVLSAFKGMGPQESRFRTALILTDALAGHTDALVEQLTILTSGKYQFAGGGAGDDARFARTHVFCGTQAYTDAVVGLEILSDKPLGIGVGHGWVPASRGFRVTESEGMRLYGLNGLPAVEAFEAHAAGKGQTFDRGNPLPFFLHNIVGIDTGDGFRLRVPLAVNDDGSVMCAAEVPKGALIHIMKATAESAIRAAEQATENAVTALQGQKPGVALFFDCVATRLRMGDVFGFELDSVAQALGGAKFVGCNTYGQIARAEGQFGGFHNCTAVVMVLPSFDE
jgi:hypothetical protein